MERSIYSKKGLISYHVKKIEELIEDGKVLLAEKIALDLLNDYYNDLGLLKALARIYTIKHDYEKAEEILESIEEVYGYIRLAAIYMKLNEEEKLLNLYEKYYLDDSVMDEQIGYDETKRRIKLYLETKFNHFLKIEIENLSYFEKQIYNYDEVMAIDHIKRHHFEKCEGKSTFCSEIDIVELFNRVRESINENKEKGTLDKNVGEIYYFRYPECGTKYDPIKLIYTNTFKVCTLLNTNKIITMYPCLEPSNAKLCYLKNENKSSKIKVKTGIERFNSKYGNLK